MSRIHEVLGFKEKEPFLLDQFKTPYRIRGSSLEINYGDSWRAVDGTSILIDLINGDLTALKNSDWMDASEIPGSPYYYIDVDNYVRDSFEEHSGFDIDLGRTNNKFRSKEKAEKIASSQLLYRKLQRFSDENSPIGFDPLDPNTEKYHICYDLEKKNWQVSSTQSYFRNDVIFFDKATAEKAISIFRKELEQVLEDMTN